MNVPIGEITSGGDGNAALFTLIGIVISTVLGTITTIAVTIINRKPISPSEDYVQFLEYKMAQMAEREATLNERSSSGGDNPS